MINESVITSQIFNILSMSPNGEPMTATEIAHEMRPEMERAEVKALLTKIVDQYGGIGKGYQTGTFKRVGNRWGVRTIASEPLTPKRAIELFL